MVQQSATESSMQLTAESSSQQTTIESSSTLQTTTESSTMQTTTEVSTLQSATGSLTQSLHASARLDMEASVTGIVNDTILLAGQSATRESAMNETIMQGSTQGIGQSLTQVNTQMAGGGLIMEAVTRVLMVEFAINSSVNTTTGYAPFELNHRYMPRSGQHIATNTTFKGVKQFAQQAVWDLLDAHDATLEHRIEQTHYSNKHRKPSVEYQINDLVYLSTKNLTLPKHRA